MTLTRGTPPCTPHMEVPPPRGFKDKEHDLFNQVIEKINNIKEGIRSLLGKNPEVS